MDKKNQDSSYSVLVVDDSADDRFFLRHSLGKEGGRLVVVGELCDGEEAMAYLGGRGKFADRQQFPVPDLMLLDLKMPKKDGHEVLAWLRNRRMIWPIVVVLTSSILPADITRSLDLGAAAYHVKTSERGQQAELIRALEKLLDDRMRRVT